MLAEKSYDRDYVDACRGLVRREMAAYGELRAVAVPVDADAVAGFEGDFLNGMVVLLDALFVHRTRAIEGKDGNPLNEVRVLTNSITRNGGVFQGEKAIKLDPAASVLGYGDGDTIRLTTTDFGRLADAYFGEIERRFL